MHPSRTMFHATFAGALLLATQLPLLAQPGPDRSRGGGAIFNPATVTTLSGTVVSITTPTAPRGIGPGLHLELKTQTETVWVHLGPRWYLEQEKFVIKSGDAITVTGSRLTSQGKPALIASSIEANGKTLRLRNEKGIPLWSGERRKGR